MGPYQGGQAQYLRVPYADFNALKLPPGTENEADFAMLADIFPTGWHGLVLAGFKPGESVAVFGAGPVGLMAAYSGIIRGASKVFVVDQVKERLEAAKKIGYDTEALGCRRVALTSILITVQMHPDQFHRERSSGADHQAKRRNG